jgi:chitodextrinase
MKPFLLLALILLPAADAAALPRDRTPPTTPTNLRVTGTTAYSVSLAWNPSTDNSGRFAYVICCSYTQSATVPQTSTRFTYTAEMEAGRSFTFQVYARDAAGNYSGASNSVTVQLPGDSIPPTKPVVSVTGVGATHAALAWQATDNGPNVWYTVFRNGSAIVQGSRSTSAIFPLLEPETDHTFVVQAQDFVGGRSPMSDPASARTTAPNPDDVTPPTTPASLSQQNWGDCEVELSWAESTDDLDPQWLIEYEIYVNDVYDHSLALRYTRTIVYGTNDGPNTFKVIAVDTAGNKSDPAEATASLNCSR